jgi:hypothetical protein
VIWTHNRSLAGQQGISSPVSLLGGLLAGLFSHLRSSSPSTDDNSLSSSSSLATILTRGKVGVPRLFKKKRKSKNPTGYSPSPRSRSTVGAHRAPDHTGGFLGGWATGTGPHRGFSRGGGHRHRTAPVFFFVKKIPGQTGPGDPGRPVASPVENLRVQLFNYFC